MARKACVKCNGAQAVRPGGLCNKCFSEGTTKMAEKPELIPLAKLNREGMQIRHETNRAYIDELAELFGEDGSWPAELPPVIAFFDGQQYWLAEGHHRVGAAEESGCPEVPTIVKKGTKREAILHACGSNSSHGLRRNPRDTERAIRTLLADAEWGQWATRQIARICRCSYRVADRVCTSVRGKLDSVKFAKGDGKERKMKREKATSSEREAGYGEEPSEGDAPAGGQSPAPGKFCSAEQNKKGPVKDELGIVCATPESIEAFESLDLFHELETLTKQLQKRIELIAQIPGAERLAEKLKCEKGVHGEGTYRHRSYELENLLNLLRAARPYSSLCPSCHRDGRPNNRNCKSCKGLPYVLKYTFELALPELQEAVKALASNLESVEE